MRYFFIVAALFIFLSGCGGEERVEHYKNGQLKSKGIVRENSSGSFVKDGVWKYWNSDGQLSDKEEYNNGSKEGLWVEWNSDGTKDEEVKYKKDKKHGIYKDWRSSGVLYKTGQYIEGQKDGKWTHFSSEGKTIEEGIYANGKKVGIWKEWYSNGQLESVSKYNKNGNLDGEYNKWFSTGEKQREKQYIDGKNIGTTNIWSKNRSKVYLARTYSYSRPDYIDSHKSFSPYGKELSSAQNGSGIETTYSENKNYKGPKDTKGRSYTCYECTIERQWLITDGKIPSYPIWIYTNGNLREKKINSNDSLLSNPD